jgi:outer membrane protein assembly factor BamB
MNLLKKLTVSLFLICVFGCSKEDSPGDPQDPVVVPVTPRPGGIVYLNCVDSFAKMNVADSSLVWMAANLNFGSSYRNPMIFDSSLFYRGNNWSMAAYSTANGARKWVYGWQTLSEGLQYREPVFNDSLVVFTSPTSEWDHADLFCVNKKTGSLKWRAQIDSGSVSVPFNTTPVLFNDKVILVTQDYNKHKHLAAYRISDGLKEWSTGVNDNLATRLRLSNGSIYSTGNQVVSCYNATDGAMQWQTDLQLSSFTGTATFFENDLLVLVKLAGTSYHLFALNSLTGNLLKTGSLTVQATDLASNALGCIYSNNKLIIANRYNFDSASVKCYDLSDLTMKWERRYDSDAYTDFTPLLANHYIIFPIHKSRSNEKKSVLYFLNLEGKEIAALPFRGFSAADFFYLENGIVYKQDNGFVYR